MALSLKGLEGPGDFDLVDSSRVRLGGGNAQPVTWSMGDPVAFGLAGLSEAYNKFAARMDELAVNDFVLKTQKEFDARYNDPEKGEFFTRRGDAAQGMFQEFQNASRDNWEKGARGALTERQMQMAHGKMTTLYRDWGDKVADFQAKETLNAKVNHVEDSLVQLADMAARGDMQSLTVALGLIQDQVKALGDMQGWSAEDIKIMAEQKTGDALIRGAITLAVTDPVQGFGMLEVYKEMIPDVQYGPARTVLEGHWRAAEARAKEAALTGYANNLLRTLDNMSFEDAASVIVRDPVLQQNPKAQKSVFDMYTSTFKLQQEAAEYQSKAALGNVQTEMRRLRDADEKDPKKYLALALTLPVDKQAGAITYSERLIKGDNVKTNPDAFVDYVNRLGKGDSFLSMTDYAGKLSLADAQTLSDPQKARQLAALLPIFQDAAAAYRMESRKVSEAFVKFQQFIPKDGFKSPKELEDALGRAMVETTMDKDWSKAKVVYGYEVPDLVRAGWYPTAGNEHARLLADMAPEGFGADDYERMTEAGQRGATTEIYRGLGLPGMMGDYSRRFEAQRELMTEAAVDKMISESEAEDGRAD
jgi:hypothetical protein